MAIRTVSTSPVAYIPSLRRRNAITPTTSPATYHTDEFHSLSTSSAIGVGVTIGIVGTVLILVTVLLLHRAWRLRHPRPVKQYRQARLWRGFEPATSSTARTTFLGNKMTNIYLTELPTPVTPAFLMSPTLRGEEEGTNESIRRHSEPV
jgi:hypothetical protein